MKKSVSTFLVALMAIFVSLSITACKGNVVKYELTDLDLGVLTVSHYEYNYIKFNFDNGTYELENKVKSNGIVTKQKGHFLVDADDYVTITNDDIPTQNYLLGSDEVIYFQDDELIIEANILGYGKVSMTFKK